MVQLGDHFPSREKREFIETSLKPGCVIRIPVIFPEITKPKFLVLVAADNPDFLTFIINSEINPFIENRPHLFQCQVKLDVNNHDFLQHDSYAACHQVWPIRKEDVVQALLADMSRFKGEISNDVRSLIVAAVTSAKTIDRDKKVRIISELEKST